MTTLPLPQLAAQVKGYERAAFSVTFYERDHPARRISALLGDGPPTPNVSSGGSVTGDWAVIPLPKRSAVTVWAGRGNLLTQDIPIVLGHIDGPPVLMGYNALHSMFRPPHPTTEPPVVRVYSPSDAVPHQALAWVVTRLAWGDAVAAPNGNRIMQKLTVSLLEYRADEVLQQEHARKPKHRGRTYIVRRGDTLTSIAKRFKVKGGWQAIGAAQKPKIHDPRKIRVGQRLLIP